MARHALCIASGELDRSVYGWQDSFPKGPSEDVVRIAERLEKRGRYAVHCVFNPTVADGLRALQTAVDSLQRNDEFVFYFSGHGGRIDTPGATGPGATKTNVICLRDGLLLDGEIGLCWAQADASVALTAVMDCCYAETSTFPPVEFSMRTRQGGRTKRWGVRAAPDNVIERVASRYRGQLAERHRVAMRERRNFPIPMRGFLVTLGACTDRELAWSYRGNGRFTQFLLSTMSKAVGSRQTFDELRDEVRAQFARAKLNQTPTVADDGTFDDEFRNRYVPLYR